MLVLPRLLTRSKAFAVIRVWWWVRDLSYKVGGTGFCNSIYEDAEERYSQENIESHTKTK